MAEKIKPTWIVCDMQGFPLCGANDKVREHKSEKAAIIAAKVRVQTSDEDQAWIFKLSHVIDRPSVDPTVTIIK